ncbi:MULTISPECIES: LacI family DNA-binding transcriptional regulator [Pantoea]|uniref:HTH lacI-type domain-containing protein n=1 Tax=Pantoea cypripedii TaxID=55209 RepID=A0A1X1EL98_PANCY|nr:substrate-binding domain-containing protein [Pantoea cypripedii]MBP2199986.1 LacI family transcriptional regulator [Pantoea cypripedii]ORM89602.1 hypothetical protein HA50_23610 [Pantoea cypripedii]
MSLSELAKDLKLSTSTVSRALNGYSDVAYDTRQRVMQRAIELGYIPNPVARRLKGGKTNMIGVVLPPPLVNGMLVEPFYSSMLGALVFELQASGLKLLITNQHSNESDDDVRGYQDMVQQKLVDAILILRTRVNDLRVKFAQQQNVSFITFGRTQSSTPHAWVDVDHFDAFYQATARQIARGHKHIAFINTSAEFNYARLRHEGYKQCLLDHQLLYRNEWQMVGGLTEMDGYVLASRLLKVQPIPTAIVCATDDIAIGAMAACRLLGLQPGKDISLIGYGNTPGATYSSPPLTTMDPFPKENGKQLGIFFSRRIFQPGEADFQHLQQARLIVRESD